MQGASLECLVHVVRQGLLGLRVNRGLPENLDPEGQRVSVSKEKKEMMVRNSNNNNNIYLVQLGCYSVAVVILHVNKT